MAVSAALAATLVVAGGSPAQATSVTYVVNSTGVQNDASGGDGICRTSVNTCTLRAALAQDAVDGVASRIEFNIPGGGPHQIPLTAGTYFLTDPGGGTVIDGYSQPGAVPNTHPTASNAVIKIEVVGNGASGSNVFSISTPNNTIRGLAIRNGKMGVQMIGPEATGNTIVGNFIGTNAAGTATQSVFNNLAIGVVMADRASRNFVGMPALADRNVVSGNAGRGIATFDFDTNDNLIRNNLVGVAPSGNGKLANLGHGIDINTGSKRNIVGGYGYNERNVTSGNGGSGGETSHGVQTRDNQWIGNFFGTDTTGNAAPSWARNGQVNFSNEDKVVNTLFTHNVVVNNPVGGVKVHKETTATRLENNLIGVTLNGTPSSNGPYGLQAELGVNNITVGPGNTIAHNDTGIRIIDNNTQRIRITGNSIHSNGGLGIDITPLSTVNQNDAGDGDSGPNTQLNFPVLTSATTSSVSGTACGGCTVEVFQADSLTTDPALTSSYGEGRTFLGSAVASGGGAFTIAVPLSSSPRAATATAIDSLGNTSEFSRNLAIPAVGNVPPTAAYTYSCTGLTCSFDGTTSTDGDGTIVDYAWNFGDSSTGSGPTTGHTFAAGGTYAVKLTVTDDDTASHVISKNVTVIDPNTPPTAAFTYSCTDLACSFDGSGSADGDGLVTTYAWDFGDTTTGSGVLAPHAFPGAGTYPVTLTVTDNDLATDDITIDVTVEAPNVAPTADFTYSCTDLVCAFDGSGSTDGDGTVVDYSWDFGDTTTGSGALTPHAFAAAGTYPVTLTVTDNDLATGDTTVDVTVTVAPTANFTYSCTDLACSFDASTSGDADGTIVDYSWDFGDGSLAGSGVLTPHAFPGTGTYPVTLTVTDDDLATDDITIDVTVEGPNVAPTANFTYACSDLACDFDATSSNDDDGTVVDYSWDFGDTTTGSGLAINHEFPAAGTYPVTLTVTDNDLATGDTTVDVTVTVAPTANFTYSCTDLACTFDASTSGDADGTIVDYSWDFGDGSLAASGVLTPHAFPGTGTYPVTLTVTDDDLASHAVVTQVAVEAPNVAPTAAFTYTCTDLVCDFDGAGSTDGDGTIVDYTWNFGDGSLAASGSLAPHTFPAAGTYQVTLTVTDNDLATDDTSSDVTVTVAPTANFTYSCTDLACTFDASTSADLDGIITTYSWNFGDGSPAGSGVTTGHTFSAGTYQVTLTVTDDDLVTDSHTAQIVVTDPALLDDGFSRVSSGGWGTAPIGGVWTPRQSFDAADLSVNGSRALLNLPSGKTRGAFLESVSRRDIDLTAAVASQGSTTGWGAYVALAARKTATNSYQARVRFEGSGQVHLSITRNDTYLGAEVQVPGVTWTPGTPLEVRFRVTGASPTTLQAKVWPVGTPEPATWLVQRTDSAAALQGSGSVGILSYVTTLQANAVLAVDRIRGILP